MTLTARQDALLTELRNARAADGVGWLRAKDVGGRNRSHHSTTLAQLVKLGLAERMARRSAGWVYRAVFPVLRFIPLRYPGERVLETSAVGDTNTSVALSRAADGVGVVLTILMLDGEAVRAIDVRFHDTIAADIGQSLLEMSCTRTSRPPPLTRDPVLRTVSARSRRIRKP